MEAAISEDGGPVSAYGWLHDALRAKAGQHVITFETEGGITRMVCADGLTISNGAIIFMNLSRETLELVNLGDILWLYN